MIYYFVEFAGSFANIALLVLFVDRLFQKKDLSSRWFYLYIALLIVGQCLLSLFPTWVMPRTIYFLLGGFLLAILFYEAQIWQAIFASAAFFTLVAVVEVLAMLLIGLQVSDTDALMQAGSARLIYVVFSNLIQIPLLILISHFFSRKENAKVFESKEDYLAAFEETIYQNPETRSQGAQWKNRFKRSYKNHYGVDIDFPKWDEIKGKYGRN